MDKKQIIENIITNIYESRVMHDYKDGKIDFAHAVPRLEEAIADQLTEQGGDKRLIELMRGLECENIDKFIEIATPNDAFLFGKLYALECKKHSPDLTVREVSSKCKSGGIHNVGKNGICFKCNRKVNQ